MKRSLSIESTRLACCGLLLVMAVAPAAEADPRGERLDRIAASIGLDAATKSQVRPLIQRSRAEAQRLRTELRHKRRALRQMMQQDAPVEATVIAQIEAIGALKTALRKTRLITMLRVRKLLSPEQRKALTAQRHGRHEGLRDACRAELSNLCADSRGRRRLGCLARKLDRLSPDCRDAVVSRFGRRDRPL